MPGQAARPVNRERFPRPNAARSLATMAGRVAAQLPGVPAHRLDPPAQLPGQRGVAKTKDVYKQMKVDDDPCSQIEFT
jgi:hypothetical protein